MSDNTNEEIHEVGENIFADLGDPDAERTYARSQMMLRIADIIKDHKLNQKQISKILDIPQSRVSELVNGKLHRFSLDTLIQILNKLDRDVEILIKPKSSHRTDGKTRVLVVTHA
ncbi:helix-turn-helix domain-containing protein [bacterium]|nr:helix-turn-helix domain-containing protein [bacterium]